MKTTEHNEMMTENFCDDCDGVIHAVFDAKDFYDFKVGRIRCECGCVVKPCNECADENGHHYDCKNCPWEHAKIANAMTDEAHIKWTKENEPNLFAHMLKGDCGDYEKKLAKKLLKECGESCSDLDDSINGVLNLIEKTVDQIRNMKNVEKKGLDEDELISAMKKMNFSLYDSLDDGLLFKDESFISNEFEAEKFFKFKDFGEVRRYINYLVKRGIL